MLNIQKKLTKVNKTVSNSRKIKYIVIHYVGAVSSAKNNVDYFYSEKRGASAHYFVDEKEIWQCVEDKGVAWHVGGAKEYFSECRNNNSIGIELCCKKDEAGGWYFEKQTIQNAIELVQHLMNLYDVKIENIIRHYDVTYKICPEPFVRDEQAWNNFKRRVNMQEFTDVNKALDYLVEKGRITNKEYWQKVIECVRNQDFLIIKWANDVKALLG